jgi:hypothetical protein
MQIIFAKVSVSDGKSRALPSRLKLCSEYLVLQREEFTIWDDEDSYPVEAGLRSVVLSYLASGEYLVLLTAEFTIWDDEDSYPVEAGLRSGE